MSGKLNYNVCIKKEHIRTDGTCAIYINIYYRGKAKKVNLNISVPPKEFDVKKRRVKSKYKYAKDYNLLIEKKLSELHEIEVSYRLNDESISLDKVLEDLNHPSLRVDFNVFARKRLEYELEHGIIKSSTYRQQKGFIEKMKRFRNPLLFIDINDDFIKELRAYLKRIGNQKPTVEGTLKNFKKYLHLANSNGIRTELQYQDIKVSSMKGNFTFLHPKELKLLYEFYNSPFINDSWKNILQRYLFSCFTGLRISDIETLNEDNFIGEHLVWTSKKTNNFNRIKLNTTAQSLIEFPHIFNGKYTREHINRELKQIAKACGIKKRLYFHSSRHTFGTNYLIAGGSLRNLQKALDHSKIETTEVYAHVVDELMNKEINLMDDLIL
ncbi:tyrosine-type recombinase/integrase [Winogradskyella sp.]|uniref:site-specific integrase n=1 Tax=Winogradskyella sp. TaxID=1883156 RepID=UPI003BAAD039